MSISESGIVLNFPDKNVFRFENCQGYKNIQDNFKEMDVCWYEKNTDTLFLIELKDWRDGKLIEEITKSISFDEIKEIKLSISKSNIDMLFKKSVDSISMIASVLLKTPYSQEIKACMPFEIKNDTKIVFLNIINWTNPDVTYILNINDAYKSKFKSYAKLFNVKSFQVMTKNIASKKFSWIS